MHGIVVIMVICSSKIAKFVCYTDIMLYVTPIFNGKLTILRFIQYLHPQALNKWRKGPKNGYFETLLSQLWMISATIHDVGTLYT